MTNEEIDRKEEMILFAFPTATYPVLILVILFLIQLFCLFSAMLLVWRAEGEIFFKIWITTVCTCQVFLVSFMPLLAKKTINIGKEIKEMNDDV